MSASKPYQELSLCLDDENMDITFKEFVLALMLVLDDARSAFYGNKESIIGNIKYLQTAEDQKGELLYPTLSSYLISNLETIEERRDGIIMYKKNGKYVNDIKQYVDIEVQLVASNTSQLDSKQLDDLQRKKQALVDTQYQLGTILGYYCPWNKLFDKPPKYSVSFAYVTEYPKQQRISFFYFTCIEISDLTKYTACINKDLEAFNKLIVDKYGLKGSVESVFTTRLYT